MDHPRPPTSDNPMFICADGDVCRFGNLNVQKNHKCTCGCGRYLHGDFCGVQYKSKRYFNKISLMTQMFQKCAANIGKTEVTYKRPIDPEEKESDSKEEEDMNDQPRHSLLLNIIIT